MAAATPPAPSAPAAVIPAASTVKLPPPAPEVDSALQGTGVSEFVPIADVAACKTKSADMATYIQRRGLGVAGRADGSFAAVWLVDLKGEAQIAFAGFDGETRQIARGRSIGQTREEGLQIFSVGESWVVAWFDPEGLAYVRPRWETTPPVEIQHLSAIGREVSDNVAIAPAPGGALVAAAPFGVERDQLGIFLFAPVDPAAPQLKALGVTHHAQQPRWPAVAADASGYFVAWHEKDGSIKASRFDAAGREGDTHLVAAAEGGGGAAGSAPGAPARERLGLVATVGAGALAVWNEGETLVARALDASARPRAAPWVLGKGKWRALAPSGEGALVAWVGHDGKADGQLLLMRLSAEGVPSARGLRVSDGVNPVKDPPKLALAGERVGVAWTEVMGPGVSTKRAVLRVLDRGCVP